MDSCTHCRSNNLHSGVIIIVLLTAVYIAFNGKLTATISVKPLIVSVVKGDFAAFDVACVTICYKI